jgi:hypothetical protein
MIRMRPVHAAPLRRLTLFNGLFMPCLEGFGQVVLGPMMRPEPDSIR